MTKFYKQAWCHKLTVLLFSTAYFITLIFINNSSYVWATLALVFVLFVTTFTCSTYDSPILLQLRGTRVGEISTRNTSAANPQTVNEEIQETPPSGSSHTTIWMSDVPPSYSIIMASAVEPPTPPPSYGSAILMFPPPYVKSEQSKPDSDQEQEPTGSQTEVRRFRPLSISTQVSMCGSEMQSPQPGGVFTLSTQLSLTNGVIEAFADTVSLRTQLFLSRQASRDESEDTPQNRVNDVFADTLQLRTRLFLSRQVSREDIPDGATESGEVRAIELHNCEIPLLLITNGNEVTSKENSDSESEPKEK